MANAKIKGIECDKCGAENPPDAKFCHACKDPIDEKDRKIIADNCKRAADVRREHLERERDAEFLRQQVERSKVNPHAPPLTFEEFMAAHPEYHLDDPSSPTFQHAQEPPTADGQPRATKKSTKNGAKKSAAKKKSSK